jgi:glycosyltransferase involved in cell wall biosynthesis
LITHNETGYLVEQKDANGLTDALSTLIPNPELRLALAQAAQENLLNNFNSQHELDTLYRRFTNTD